jgi:hypothetical protein
MGYSGGILNTNKTDETSDSDLEFELSKTQYFMLEIYRYCVNEGLIKAE